MLEVAGWTLLSIGLDVEMATISQTNFSAHRVCKATGCVEQMNIGTMLSSYLLTYITCVELN
jgi:hypothetical protein